DTIVKELWRGRGIVPNSMIAKGHNHYDASLPPFRHDPKEARERLKKAGYRSEEIVLETTVGYMANDKPMAEAVVGMWRDVGVNARVEVFEYSVRAQKNREKTFKGLWWSDPTSTLADPAVPEQPLQLHAPSRLTEPEPVHRCLGAAACPAGKPRLSSPHTRAMEILHPPQGDRRWQATASIG